MPSRDGGDGMVCFMRVSSLAAAIAALLAGSFGMAAAGCVGDDPVFLTNDTDATVSDGATAEDGARSDDGGGSADGSAADAGPPDSPRLDAGDTDGASGDPALETGCVSFHSNATRLTSGHPHWSVNPPAGCAFGLDGMRCSVTGPFGDTYAIYQYDPAAGLDVVAKQFRWVLIFDFVVESMPVGMDLVAAQAGINGYTNAQVVFATEQSNTVVFVRPDGVKAGTAPVTLTGAGPHRLRLELTETGSDSSVLARLDGQALGTINLQPGPSGGLLQLGPFVPGTGGSGLATVRYPRVFAQRCDP